MTNTDTELSFWEKDHSPLYIKILLWIALPILVVGFYDYARSSDLPAFSSQRLDSLFPALLVYILAATISLVSKGISYQTVLLIFYVVFTFTGIGLIIWSLFIGNEIQRQGLSGFGGLLFGWGTGMPIGDFIRVKTRIILGEDQ